MESQEVEEGGSITLHCELSKPGLAVEWKKETQVLSYGEKYHSKQTGCIYELQIFGLRPGDTGSYSCCSEDTTSSASLVVNGMIETMSSSHAVFFCRQVFHFIFQSTLLHLTAFFIAILDLVLQINILLFLFIHQLPRLFSQKNLKAKQLMRATVWACIVSSLNPVFFWSGGKENLVFVLVPSMKLYRQDTWLH